MNARDRFDWALRSDLGGNVWIRPWEINSLCSSWSWGSSRRGQSRSNVLIRSTGIIGDKSAWSLSSIIGSGRREARTGGQGLTHKDLECRAGAADELCSKSFSSWGIWHGVVLSYGIPIACLPGPTEKPLRPAQTPGSRGRAWSASVLWQAPLPVSFLISSADFWLFGRTRKEGENSQVLTKRGRLPWWLR